jgi:probable F420-dependent oxidoreductase
VRNVASMSGDTRLGVQIDPRNATELLDAARAAEAAGLYAVFVPDHPGSCVSPFVTLAAAASATERIRLGTYVLNAGIHHPVQVANDVNTLDLLSDGRAILGVGAGHTPAEWTQRGLEYPAAAARVERMISFTEHVRALCRGDVLNAVNDIFTLHDAVVRHPVAQQSPIPLLVGGNGPRVLRYAGAHSDIVSVSGLGATKSDGHTHVPKWSHTAITESVGHVRAGADGRTVPVIEALVQALVITNDRTSALGAFARRADIDVSLIEDIPFILVGTLAHIADQIAAHRERWGFTSFVARAAHLTDLAAVAEHVS